MFLYNKNSYKKSKLNFTFTRLLVGLLFNYYLVGNSRFKVHIGLGMNYRLLNKTTNEIFAEARRSAHDVPHRSSTKKDTKIQKRTRPAQGT